MSALHRKLLRDLWRMRAQVVTISLVVACGIASHVTVEGTRTSLLAARDAYYERYRFPDVFVHLQRAARSLDSAELQERTSREELASTEFALRVAGHEVEMAKLARVV
jgi:putative ABC transport system permease protein